MGQGGRGCRYQAGVSLSCWSTLDYLSLLGERWIPVPLPPARESSRGRQSARAWPPEAARITRATRGLVSFAYKPNLGHPFDAGVSRATKNHPEKRTPRGALTTDATLKRLVCRTQPRGGGGDGGRPARLYCAYRYRLALSLMVGDIISERWARSSRNGGRHHSGIEGGLLPESAPRFSTNCRSIIRVG
jgi:hypothetical protein